MQISDAPSIAGPGHNLATTEDIIRDRFSGLFQEVNELATRANNAKDALGEASEVTSDEQRDPLVKLGIEAKKLAKRVKETRLNYTEPVRKELDDTKKLFDGYEVRAQRICDVFEQIVGAYDEKKRNDERRRAAAKAQAAAEEAKRKLDEAADAEHSIVGDVILDEAAEAHQRALEAQARVQLAGKGPTRTDAGTISQSAPWTFRIVDVTKIPMDELRPYFGVDAVEKALRAFVRANKGTRTLAGVDFFQESKTTFRG